jgi:large repetitive protein
MKKQRQIFRPRSSSLALEPRVMFDGAAAIAVDEHLFTPQSEGPADVAETRPTPAVESTAANPAPGALPTTLLIVDSRVADYQSLLSDLPGNVMVRVINPGESGLAAINSAISGHTDLQSIQIISHGSSGSLTLGTDTINNNTLSSQGSQIQSWAPHLSGDADILLYGCDIGAGTAGTTLLTQLAGLTGADIAASTDATGSATRGGNWILEQQTGQIESGLVVTDSALVRYDGLFATPAIGGGSAGQVVNDNSTSTPFSAVTITDSDMDDTQALSVTLDAAAKGTLSTLSGGTYDADTGVYIFSGTTAAAQAAIQALVFTPTANRVAPDSTETTTFTISVYDGTNTVTDSTTTVICTSINDAPAAVADTIAPYEDTNAAPIGNLLANDTDLDTNDPKAVTSIRLGAVAGSGSTGSLVQCKI